MAEPARVYDPEDKEDKPLSAAERAKRSWGIETGGQDDEQGDESEDTKKSAREKANERWGMSPDEIKDAEESAEGSESSDADQKESDSVDDGADQVGKGYKGGDKSRLMALTGMLTGLRGKRRGWAIGGGIIAVLVGLIVTAFITLLPLKILHIVENLQNRFFATSESAVGKTTERLLSNYLLKYVKPSLSRCSGSTVDRGCNPIIGTGDNPVTAVYRGWGQARLENTLATKYGLEFKKKGNNFYIKIPGYGNVDGIDVTSFVNAANDDLAGENLFEHVDKRVGRNELRQTIRQALEEETKWKRTMYRFKVGRLMERKYGLKRCLFACTTRDNFADWKDSSTNRAKQRLAKIVLADRVLGPRAASLRVILGCVLDTDCHPDRRLDSSDASAERRTKFERELQEEMQKLAAKIGTEGVEDIVKQADEILDKGFTKYAIEEVGQKVIGKVIGNQASKRVTDAVASSIPVVNALNFAAVVVDVMKDIGPKIKYMAYAGSATQAVHLYMMYRSHADELRSGHVDADLVGAMTNTLSPNQQDTGDGTFGGAGAEATPLYGALISGGTNPSTALLDSFMPGSAMAASNYDDYLCDDGKPVAADKLVCPEEDFRQENFFTGIGGAFDKPPLSILGAAADAWNGIKRFATGWATDFLGNIVSSFPGVKQIGDAVAQIIQPIFETVVKYLVPSAVSDNMSGGRTFNVMAAGANAAGSEYAHNGLGGRVLSNPEVGAILEERQSEAQQDFQSQPFFARMFDKKSEYSLVSKIAMAMPTNLSTMISSGFTNLIRNPFTTLVNGFGTLFTGRTMAAGTGVDMCTDGGPFGIPCYGYTDAEIPEDPEAYWDTYCQGDEAMERWLDDARSNPDTAQWDNHTVNPCMLIQSTAGSAAGYFTDEVLTADDLNGSSYSDNSATTTPGATTPSGGSVYVIGDSISVGMSSSGNLAQQLQTNGMTTTGIQATQGDNIGNAIPKLKADSSKVSSASKIIVELGTNHCRLSQGTTPSCVSTPLFEQQIDSMISAIRAINPTAQIYWVNIFTTRAEVYKSINQAISNKSSSLNYRVIDWAAEVLANRSKYVFDDNSLGVHLQGNGYTSMAQFIAGAVK